MKIDMKKVSEYLGDYDMTWPSEEKMLFMRLEELYGRKVKSKEDAGCYERFSDDDLRHVPADDIKTMKDIKRAVKIVKNELAVKYGIDAEDFIETVKEENKMPAFEQIVFAGFACPQRAAVFGTA